MLPKHIVYKRLIYDTSLFYLKNLNRDPLLRPFSQCWGVIVIYWLAEAFSLLRHVNFENEILCWKHPPHPSWGPQVGEMPTTMANVFHLF